MDVDGGALGFGGGGGVEHLGDDGVDAGHFAADGVGEFGVLIFFEEEIQKGFDGDEGVF